MGRKSRMRVAASAVSEIRGTSTNAIRQANLPRIRYPDDTIRLDGSSSYVTYHHQLVLWTIVFAQVNLGYVCYKLLHNLHTSSDHVGGEVEYVCMPLSLANRRLLLKDNERPEILTLGQFPIHRTHSLPEAVSSSHNRQSRYFAYRCPIVTHS